MKRSSFTLMIAAAALLLAAVNGNASPLRGAFTFEYGTASNTFGLSSPGFFDVPVQTNSSSDGIISGSLEYLVVQGWRLDLGFAVKGSFAFSDWYLGSTTVTDGVYLYPDDGIHISSDWWAVAAMGTAHLHLGPWVSLDAALGYGPYGYTDVNYSDDAGVVSGPVTQGSGIFPKHAWSLDWSVGLSFRSFWLVTFSLDVGMMGPDFVSGLGVGFPL